MNALRHPGFQGAKLFLLCSHGRINLATHEESSAT
jgi:hypothetical protein